MFIAYDVKNGKEYGKLCISKRNGSKTSKDYINLGLVLDKDKLIFKNRERGVFRYDPETNGFLSPDPSVMIPEPASAQRERLILDFGDSFLLDSFIE